MSIELKQFWYYQSFKNTEVVFGTSKYHKKEFLGVVSAPSLSQADEIIKKYGIDAIKDSYIGVALESPNPEWLKVVCINNGKPKFDNLT